MLGCVNLKRDDRDMKEQRDRDGERRYKGMKGWEEGDWRERTMKGCGNSTDDGRVKQYRGM